LDEGGIKRLIDDVHPLVGKLNVAMGRDTKAIHTINPDGKSVLTFKKEKPSDASRLATHVQQVPGKFRTYKLRNREFDPTYFEVIHD
jgi:hypothetical protein